jgi:hypothetical protein
MTDNGYYAKLCPARAAALVCRVRPVKICGRIGST